MNSKKIKDSKPIDEKDIKTFNRDEIQDNFPSIFKEMVNNTQISSEDLKSILTEDSNSIAESTKEIEFQTKLKEKDYLQGFDPKATDFIRRAKTKTEAIEVIEFLAEKQEITLVEAENLKKKLQEKSLTSFGEHKADGFYFEFQSKQHLKEKMKLSGKQPNTK